MADRPASWKPGPVLAWTEREGPGRPPAAPSRALSLGLAATLGVVFTAMIGTDALCPEHRAWVQGLASLALVGTAVAAVGLARGWSSAPLLTVGVASTGVAIGALDAVHNATRGGVLVAAFALVTLAACVLAARQARLARWERRAAATLAPVAGAGTASLERPEPAASGAGEPASRPRAPSLPPAVR